MRLLAIAIVGMGLLAGTPVSADTLTVDNFPITPDTITPSGGIASLGELVGFLQGPSSFYGQSFIAPSAGRVYADKLTFSMMFYGQAPGPVNYRILLVSTGAPVAPSLVSLSQVIFESESMVLPASSPWTDITVSLGDTQLLGGNAYLWVIDAYTDRDGVSGLANVGTKNNFADGSLYTLNVLSGDRANFSLSQFGDVDLAFQMTFQAGVPEPSTWAMLLLGFASVGFLAYRRRN